MTPELKAILHLTAFLLAFHSSVQPAAALDEVSRTGEAQEYCLTEPFRAKCLSSEVIVMTSSLYGRMKVGRCLRDEGEELLKENDPRFLGCSMDVLDILDRRCSAKNQCEVRLTYDADLQRKKPCRAGLMSYLEASYECVQVIEADRSCHVTVSSNPLHIMHSSSSTSALLNCGTKTQPWVLEAPAGQQINVSLLHFGLQQRERGSNQQHCSQQYGYIVDKAAMANKNISLCGLGEERNRIVYQSVSNTIEMTLHPHHEIEDDSDEIAVLIGLQAVGCSNMVPPEDAWFRRSNNEAVVGCYSSRQSWHLRCVDNVWVGVIGNCTREVEVVKSVDDAVSPSLENQVLLPVAVGAIGLIVCVVIVICGIVCIRRYSAMSKGSGYLHHQEEDKLAGGGGGKYLLTAAPFTQHAPLNGTTMGTGQQQV